jgi:hypothetical protein
MGGAANANAASYQAQIAPVSFEQRNWVRSAKIGRDRFLLLLLWRLSPATVRVDELNAGTLASI